MSVEVQTQEKSEFPAGSRMTPLVTEQQLTLMEVWRVLMKQRFIIILVTLVSLAGACWYAFGTPPVYESVARVEIRPQEQPNVGLDQLLQPSQSGEQASALSTEMRILQSDSVLYQTAQSLGLINRIRAAAAARARKKGKAVAVPTGEITPAERRAMIGFIKGGLSVAVLNGTNIVEIHYRNGDPKLAAAIVNQLVETYSDEDLRTKYERTMHVSNWLQGQLQGLRTEASEAQQQLAAYQKAHNIVGTDANSNLTLQSLQDFSSSVDSAEADRITKHARMRDFSSLGPNLAALVGDNPTLASLRSQLVDLQMQRAELSAKFGPRYPRMIDLQTQINNVQEQINDELALARSQVRDEYQGAVAVEDALRKRLEAQEEAAYKLNEGAAQYAILRNQAELTRDLYDTLQMRLKEATVTAGLSAASITVVDSAQVSYAPVAPRKRLSIMMGFFGGLLGGCVLAFLIESIDDRLQTSDEVESVTGLPALAAIPLFRSETDKRGKQTRKRGAPVSAVGLAQRLVSLRDPKSIVAESYRNLRSSLLLSCIDNPPRIIVVTSAFPEEGKTTTAINCAIVLAQRGERVLLVDADLRRGSMDAVFGLSGSGFGLSTVLANLQLQRDIPAPLPELPTLHFLATGPRPPNPAEMLSSARMEEQLRQWSQEYDRIVLDTAPVLSVADTQAMAVFADTVLLVARAGMTRRRALIRARDLLLRINAPIAGVVMNGVDVRLENFYTYRYGMYGYGGYGLPYSDRAYGYDQENQETD